MTAHTTRIRPHPARTAGRTARWRSAFTLTELLIVIAIIVLLVSLLLAAMAQVQAKGRETRTLATMQAFSNACDAFQQEHGFYPGVVPEAILAVPANQGQLTGTENAVLHLMGGFVREEDVGDGFGPDYPAPEWVPLVFHTAAGTPYRIKISVARIGEGPIIDDKPYAPYLTPGDDEFGLAEGQEGDDTGVRVPEILDAWGQPILYLRRSRSVGPLTDTNPGNRPQFDGAPMSAYCESTALGKFGKNQVYAGGNPTGSILSSGVADDVRALNLKTLLQHPALPGQARGSYLLLSAGKDGIYLSAEDGPGAPGDAVTDVGEQIEMGDLPPTIFDEYDDVVLYGGG